MEVCCFYNVHQWLQTHESLTQVEKDNHDVQVFGNNFKKGDLVNNTFQQISLGTDMINMEN